MRKWVYVLAGASALAALAAALAPAGHAQEVTGYTLRVSCGQAPAQPAPRATRKRGPRAPKAIGRTPCGKPPGRTAVA